MKRIAFATALAATFVMPPLARAAEKYDAGTLEGRGSTALANTGGPLAAELQGKPVVVRIHADWCPACKQTEPVLDGIKKTYGDRVRFVTFNVTNDHTATDAAVLAERDGLSKFFEATKAATSTVAIVEPKSGAIVAELYNDVEASDYTKAIDKALAAGR